jgi:acetoin utilization deacetylase AcuC-like enzyme
VIDLDVHQGNGTAAIFAGDDSVFTFSIHQENNYPVKEESDLDIGLDDGTGDAEYLALLKNKTLLRHRKAELRPTVKKNTPAPLTQDQP